MMTSVLRGRRERRYLNRADDVRPPIGWCWGDLLPRACIPKPERGSATPGRGGRRKRRRRAAGTRAAGIWSAMCERATVPTALERTALDRALSLIPDPGRSALDLGRRERRRRAKLRRRRARAEREWRRGAHQIKRALRSWKRLPFTPGLWGALVMSFILDRAAGKDRGRMAEMFGVSPTRGA